MLIALITYSAFDGATKRPTKNIAWAQCLKKHAETFWLFRKKLDRKIPVYVCSNGLAQGKSRKSMPTRSYGHSGVHEIG